MSEKQDLVDELFPEHNKVDAVTSVGGFTVGDAFYVKPTLTIENDKDDEITGVTTEMLQMKGRRLIVSAIITKLGVPWIVDHFGNFFWRLEWIEPASQVHIPPSEEKRYAHRVSMDERDKGVLGEDGKLIAGYFFWIAFIGLLVYLVAQG